MTNEAIPAPSARDRRFITAAFGRAFGREAHVFAGRPDLLWPQLYNRLQWWGEALTQALASELKRRTAPGSTPWLRTKAPFPDSPALVRSLIGHGASVEACAVSTKPAVVLSASQDGTLKLWDYRSGANEATLLAHDDKLFACALSDDGSKAASGSSDTTVRIWDVATRRAVATLSGHTDVVLDCAFSPNGSLLASAGDDTLKLWDVETGRLRKTLSGHSHWVNACAFTPDGSLVVSASDDKTLRVWDVTTGATLVVLRGHRGPVRDCAVGADGAFVVSASEDGTLMIWDLASGRVHATLEGHDGAVHGTAISPDGSRIISAGFDDGTIKVWSRATAREEATWRGHPGGPLGCVVTADGKYVVSCGGDYTLQVWELDQTGSSEPALERHTGRVAGCAADPHGSFFVTSSEDGTLKRWHPETADLQQTLRGHREPVWSCAVSVDGRAIVSGSFDGTIKLWSAETGHEESTFHASDDRVFDCALSPDGRFIISGSRDGAVTRWSVRTGRRLSSMTGHRGGAAACAFAHDGSLIAVGALQDAVKIWDGRTGEQRETLAHEGVVSCAFSPDDALLASAGRDGKIRLWEPRSGRLVGTLAGHTPGYAAQGVAFAPDGSFLVSTGADGMLKLWDLTTMEERAALALPGGLARVAVHPYKGVIFCGNQGGWVFAVDILGVEYGEVFVRAIDGASGPRVRCPKCLRDAPVPLDSLGRAIDCPAEGCSGRMRIHEVVGAVPQRLALPWGASRRPPGTLPRTPRLVGHGSTPNDVVRSARDTTVEELLQHTELSYSGGRFPSISFPAARGERVVVGIRRMVFDESVIDIFTDLRSSNIQRYDVLAALLRASLVARYLRAGGADPDQLRLSARLPAELTTPEIAEGLIKSLALLASTLGPDGFRADDWEERLYEAMRTQRSYVYVDTSLALNALLALAEERGVEAEQENSDTVALTLTLNGVSSPVSCQISEHAISFRLPLGELPHKRFRKPNLWPVLDLNSSLDVARVGLGSSNELVAVYEIPAINIDTIDELRREFEACASSALTDSDR